MGGMDLFFTKLKDDGSWEVPKNLGYPINTIKSENSLILNSKGNMAYISSSREGGFHLLCSKRISQNHHV